MPPSSEPASADAQYRLRVITWAAMLMSIVMYGVILKVVPSKAAGANPMLEQGLLVAAAALVAVSFAVKTFFFQRARASGNSTLIRTGELVACSLCEAAALCGLLLWFLAASPRAWWFLALGAVGHLLHFPRREE